MIKTKVQPVEIVSGAPVRQVGVTSAASIARAEELGREIDGQRILREITFDIRAGEYVALLGANGAGKSTLLKVLATLVPPSQGRLALFDQVVNGGAPAIRARLGMIGHASMMYRDLSARQNLVLFGRLYGVRDPDGRATELLDLVGLRRRADDAVRTFSRGMAQRAAIARALMHDPELLLADEPFAGLDAPSTRALENLLDQLHAQGRTIILASHDLRRSLELADRAIVLRRGRVVIDAPSHELEFDLVLSAVSP